MTKNVLKIIAGFVIGIVGGIFADQILWPYIIEKPLFLEYRLEQSPIYLTETKEIFIQENVALQDAVDKVSNVVVGIRTETVGGRVLERSGLIVTSDGLVVSLDDFFPKGSKVTLFFDGKTLVPKVIQIRDGLALLRIEEDGLPTVDFADPGRMRLGQRAFLVGAVFEKLSVGKMVNEGIIKYFDEDLIKTNIVEEESLEGSILFDIEGNVLGLNLINSEGKVNTIPISQIREFLGF